MRLLRAGQRSAPPLDCGVRRQLRMFSTIKRAHFWQFGGLAFAAGLGAGLLAGASLFAVAVLLVLTILSAVAMVLVTAIKATSMGEDGQALYENLWVFSFVASAAVAAFAGYCLGVLLTRGFYSYIASA